MDYKYYLGGGIIKVDNEINRIETILKICNERVEEIHIIKDPFPQLSIKSIINQDGEFEIIEDIPLKEIEENEYTDLLSESKRSAIY